MNNFFSNTGIVLSFNKLAGMGILQDSHNQTLKFYSEQKRNTFQRGDRVSFDTELLNKCVIAKNLKLLNAIETAKD